ncbi:ATP-binding protein [Streptomyces aidingensis]|uniref:CO dehydrogenase maturation factor n=1 Tax=Streptomyces aidingensis TaxID=910347 RepID=A0A1I1KI84_9ACTN|nr:ATP-binding protein [Streptomyces aidingensis]SFC60566.1 CO dehydrogenase maturation factor [Streptomyces aidingensis]
MKIAFVGKGGSGKTTLSALFVRHLAAAGVPVTAVDADINQHLGPALGLTEEQAAALPPLAGRLPLIKEYLRGDNPRIPSADAMIKTTPPGSGSRLLRLDRPNPVFDACARTVRLDGGAGGEVRLLATGTFTEDDLGVSCYHSKTGALELCLNHLVDGRGEYLVADMTAGSDSFGSGLFSRFDLTFLVAEPTRKGVAVYRQYRDYAREFGVALRVVGNKVQGEEDEEFLREEVGDDLLLTFGHSPWVRALERGRSRPFAELEEPGRAALRLLHQAADAAHPRRDWERYTELMHHFHLKNAESWGNARAGADLAAQIDPGFVLREDGTAEPAGRAAVPQPA